MTENPNCSNCPHKVKKNHHILPHCTKNGLTITTIYQDEVISPIGCLSHPGAREYLMAPVIVELERLSALCDTRTGFQDQQTGYDRAIALIRGGVNNESI